MLTEADKKWLVARQQNMEESGWNSCESGELRHLVDFHHKKLHSDWKDAAEFEARVSAKLAEHAGDIALTLQQAGLDQLEAFYGRI